MANSSDQAKKLRKLSAGTAIGFVVLFGVISMFSDMTYEGGRSLVGQFLNILGASAVAVGISAGAGEFLGYAIRFISGFISDKTQKYWAVTIVGYSVQLLALPALALIGRWEIAIVMVFLERIGKAIRNPSRDAMLSYATSQTGRGFGFGLHEAMDQIGAFLGPVALSIILYVKGRAAMPDEIGSYHLGFALLLIPAGMAIAILITARFLFPNPQDLEVKTPKIGTKFSKAYWLYLVAAGFFAAGFADFALVGFHFKQTNLIPEYLIPTFYAVAMVVDAGAALIFGWLYDKKGFPVLIIAFALAALFAPFAFLGGPGLAIVGLALWGIGMGAQESIMRAAVADLAPAEKRGTAYGMFHTYFGLLWFAGSALMGLLYDWNIMAIVIFSVAIQLVAMPVFLLANKWRNKELAEAASAP